ncbi:hypothetical protein PFISCL1PPCAC_19027, partial [Pristionchus fissidentatus]
ITATDSLVEDLYKKFPSLGPYDEKEATVFKIELIRLLTMPIEEQDVILAGFPSEFKILPAKIKVLNKIAKKEFAQLSDEDKEQMENVNESTYLLYFLTVNPVIRLTEKRKKECEKKGLNDEEID